MKEEAGIVAEVVGKIPGLFSGSVTQNEYFLMAPVADTKKFEDETQSIRWVTESEAKLLICNTINPAGKSRDLKLLNAAFEMFRRESVRQKPSHNQPPNAPPG